MDVRTCFFVTLFVGLCLIDLCNCKGCGAPTTATTAIIPDGMLLSTFDSAIVDQELRELYFALPKPPIFVPSKNYVLRLIKTGTGQYRYISQGESVELNPQCERGNVTLELTGSGKTARFIRSPESSPALEVYWSSCPDKYLLGMRCTTWTSKNRCPMEDVMMAILLKQDHSSLDDMPMDDIVRDLCPTKISVGASNFKWFYSFGDNTLC